jgi:hypothetical protein
MFTPDSEERRGTARKKIKTYSKFILSLHEVSSQSDITPSQRFVRAHFIIGEKAIVEHVLESSFRRSTLVVELADEDHLLATVAVYPLEVYRDLCLCLRRPLFAGDVTPPTSQSD